MSYDENEIYDNNKNDDYIEEDNDYIEKELEVNPLHKNYNYPTVDDDNMMSDIYKKREFHIHRIPPRKKIETFEEAQAIRDDKCHPKEREFTDHQLLVSNYINPDTPYKGLLLYHGTGSGKSAGSIAIAEKFKPMVEKYGTRIYVLVPGPLNKENYKNEILLFTGDTYKKQFMNPNGNNDEDYITSNAKLAINQYYRIMSYRSFYRKVLGEKKKEKIVEGNKTRIVVKKNEEGEIDRDVSIDKILNLNNTILIIDEAHNITGNEYGDAIKKIINESINLKVLLLTATPMSNTADEIVNMINYLRPMDDQIQRDKIFNVPNRVYEMELKDGGLDYLKKMCRGYVSYLRGSDPITYADKVEKGEVPRGLLFTKLIKCNMEPFQLEKYNEEKKHMPLDSDEDNFSHGGIDKGIEAVTNCVFPGLSNDKKSLIKLSGITGLNLLRNQLQTYETELNKIIAKDLFKGKEDKYLYLTKNDKQITGKIFHENNLKTISTKFYQCLIDIKGPGTRFVYSNLVRFGIELFQEVLKQNGYLEYDESGSYQISPSTICYHCNIPKQNHSKAIGKEDHDFSPATFMAVTGKTQDEDTIPEEKHKIIKEIFNNIKNRHGKFIKIMLGSKVMNEGITLKNLSSIHILDVHFNLGKVDQVMGRGIRYCVHYDVTTKLNPNPKVEVYKYSASLPTQNELSSDEMMYKKAELKYLLVKKTERAIQEVAIDCPLNRNGNIFPEEVEQHKNCQKDNSCPVQCGYMTCEYKCDSENLNKLYYDSKTNTYIKLTKDQIDYTTFHSDLAREEINFSKSIIKEMFKIKTSYQLDEIIKNVRNKRDIEKRDLFQDHFIFKGLDEMIPLTENDFNSFSDIIKDAYNRPGYIIFRDKYYIYQPFEENENLPYYYRSNYNFELKKRTGLHNYLKNNKLTKIDYKEDEIIEGYDFKTSFDYYNSKPENKYIGIIDKQPTKKGYTEGLVDTFKLRIERPKVLTKKRQTGIASYLGAVCYNAFSVNDLIKIGKTINLTFTEKDRTKICNLIHDRLEYMEKYGIKEKKQTYLMIPANHETLIFPLNLEDRMKYIINEIQKLTNTKPEIKIVKTKLPNTIKLEGFEPVNYLLSITDTPEMNLAKNIIDKYNGRLEKGIWNFNIV